MAANSALLKAGAADEIVSRKAAQRQNKKHSPTSLCARFSSVESLSAYGLARTWKSMHVPSRSLVSRLLLVSLTLLCLLGGNNVLVCRAAPTPSAYCTRSTNQQNPSCGLGLLFTTVNMASFGFPVSCSVVNTSCHATTSLAVVQRTCLNRRQCSVPSTVAFFGEDPCVGSSKALAIDMTCGAGNPLTPPVAATPPAGCTAGSASCCASHTNPVTCTSPQVSQNGTCIASCPAGTTSLSASPNNICIATGCQVFSTRDCSVCLFCTAPLLLTSDGRCQPPPTLTMSMPGFPSFACGTNISIGLDPSSTTRSYTWSMSSTPNSVTAAGAASTQGAFACTHTVSGSTLTTATPTLSFPYGSSIVSCSVTDSLGLRSNVCQFYVYALDMQPPDITCPASFNTTTEPGLAYRNLTQPILSVSDAVDGVGQNVNRSCFIPSSIFANPAGGPATTNITCFATDLSMNSAFCTYSVTIVDNEPPVLSACPVNTTLLETPSTGFGSFAWTRPTATDNVNPIVNVTCSHNSTLFPIGRTIVSCVAADSNLNVASCVFAVTITDNTPPSVLCPASFTVNTLQNFVNVTWSTPTASDNQGVVQTEILLGGVSMCPSSQFCSVNMSELAVGQSNFLFRATDAAGLTNSCTWRITVIVPADVTPPTILSGCNSTINNPYTLVVPADPGLASTVVTWPDFNVTDDRGVVATGYLSSPLGFTRGSTYLLGIVNVTFFARDAASNQVLCNFLVRVVDVEPPTLTGCTGNTTRVLTFPTDANKDVSTVRAMGTCTLPTHNCLPTLTATDNVLAPANQQIFSILSFTTLANPSSPNTTRVSTSLPWQLPVGSFSTQFSATDTSNNTALCLFRIDVIDTQPPTITGCARITRNATLGASNVYVSCPTITASDNVNVSSLSFTPALTSICNRFLTIGNYSVNVSATDTSNNTISCTWGVTVNDVEPPTLLTGPAVRQLYFDADPDVNYTTLSYIPFSAADNSGSLASVTYNPPFIESGMQVLVGRYNCSFVAIDPSGNRLTVLFYVEVRDTQPPIISGCLSNSTSIYTWVNSTLPGQAVGVLTWSPLSATDNAGIKTIAYSPSNAMSDRTWPLDTTTVTYTVTDFWNNVATCTFYILIEDREPPRILNCPTPTNATAPTVISGAVDLRSDTGRATWPLITSSDNSNALATQYVSSPTGFSRGALFRFGVTNMSFVATDAAGNIAQCDFQVWMRDTQPPVFTFCTTDVVVLSAGQLTYATWSQPLATDNIEVVNITTTLPEGIYELGHYNGSYTAIDSSGNNASCFFNLTIALREQGASTSQSTIIGSAAGAGAAALLVVALVFVLVLVRRNQKKRLAIAAQGYQELLAMSDEYILERARNIQTTLMEQKHAKPLPDLSTVKTAQAFKDPPKTSHDLESYLRDTLHKHLNRDEIRFGNFLGRGEFGEVHEGMVGPVRDETKVAIKQLQLSTSDESKTRFLKEAAIMAQFDHPNIVKLFGVCFEPRDKPVLIVLEYMHLGSLEGYLHTPMVKNNLGQLVLVRMAIDVCAGMHYLAQAGFVHRDLAARNVLIDKELTCRIGDFGLSVGLASASDDDNAIYSGSADVRIPIRWSAIEAVLYRHFSTASDVWSFGILLWEIWTYADVPYKGMNNKEVTKAVMEGMRLPKPDKCPSEVYKLMIQSWNKNPKKRITFVQLASELVELWNTLQASGEESGFNGRGDATYVSSSTAVGSLYDNQMNPDEPVDFKRRDSLLEESNMSMYDLGASDLTRATADHDDDDDDESDSDGEAGAGAGAGAGRGRASGIALNPIYSDSMGLTAKETKRKKKQVAPLHEYEYDSSLTTPGPAGRGSMAYYDLAPVHMQPNAIIPPDAAAALQGRGRRDSTLAALSPGVITTSHLGHRVTVRDYGLGLLRFVGPNVKDGETVCGVELDGPTGTCDGTVDGHEYFVCPKNHGVLVPDSHVGLSGFSDLYCADDMSIEYPPTVPYLDVGSEEEEEIPRETFY